MFSDSECFLLVATRSSAKISSMASAIHSFPPPEECDASTASKPKTPLSPTSHNLPSLKPVLRPSTSAPRKSDDSTRVRFEGVLSPNEWEGKEEEDVSMVEVTSDDDSVRLAGSQEVPKEEAADEEAEEGLAPLHSRSRARLESGEELIPVQSKSACSLRQQSGSISFAG